MSYKYLSHIKHRMTLTGEEIALLRDRLVPIAPIDYDLNSFSILRNLYGRLDHYCLTDGLEHARKKGG
ncbi:hypothetical protein ES708_15786 [subsurface metagenome]